MSCNHLTAALDRSLKRLNTDYVDVCQAHSVPMNEKDYVNLSKAFKKMKKNGKEAPYTVAYLLEEIIMLESN